MPTVAEVEAWVTGISSGLSAILGLNYYALVWAFFGALIPLTQSRRFDGLTAIAYVLFSTMLGALIGTLAADLLGVTQRSAICLMAVVGGASWQSLIAIAIREAEQGFTAVLRTLFTRKPPPPPPQ